MSNSDTKWLLDFSDAAKNSDQFKGRHEHVHLLAIGLIGEAGSIVSEFKKKKREGDVYPSDKDNMLEEVGDFLWYFVRFCSVIAPNILKKFQMNNKKLYVSDKLFCFINFSTSVGDVAREVVSENTSQIRIELLLNIVWNQIQSVAHEVDIDLCIASNKNINKTKGRWPEKKIYAPLFDNNYTKKEQLPKSLTIEFLETQERLRNSPKITIQVDTVRVEYNGKKFGDPLNDNSGLHDGYRYHDIFHFAHAVYLGWSPVVRRHLRRKRKSNPIVDEQQDGLRAVFLEEGMSAVIFGQAKLTNFFEKKSQVNYDLLKTIQQVVKGFEVEIVPVWQWEKAILEGYKVFRKLRENKGGKVKFELSEKHRLLEYISR